MATHKHLSKFLSGQIVMATGAELEHYQNCNSCGVFPVCSDQHLSEVVKGRNGGEPATWSWGAKAYWWTHKSGLDLLWKNQIRSMWVNLFGVFFFLSFSLSSRWLIWLEPIPERSFSPAEPQSPTTWLSRSYSLDLNHFLSHTHTQVLFWWKLIRNIKCRQRIKTTTLTK